MEGYGIEKDIPAHLYAQYVVPVPSVSLYRKSVYVVDGGECSSVVDDLT